MAGIPRRVLLLQGEGKESEVYLRDSAAPIIGGKVRSKSMLE